MNTQVPVLLVEDDDIDVAGYIIKPVDFPQFIEAVRVINLYWNLSESAPCTC